MKNGRKFVRTVVAVTLAIALIGTGAVALPSLAPMQSSVEFPRQRALNSSPTFSPPSKASTRMPATSRSREGNGREHDESASIHAADVARATTAF